MDIDRFKNARNILLKSRYSSCSPTQRDLIWKALEESAAPEHVGKAVSISLYSDNVVCSCGWESPGYWDLLPAAWDDWVEHVADTCGLLPRKCACGKEFVPAEGGNPCHELRPLEK